MAAPRSARFLGARPTAGAVLAASVGEGMTGCSKKAKAKRRQEADAGYVAALGGRWRRVMSTWFDKQKYGQPLQRGTVNSMIERLLAPLYVPVPTGARAAPSR